MSTWRQGGPQVYITAIARIIQSRVLAGVGTWRFSALNHSVRSWQQCCYRFHSSSGNFLRAVASLFCWAEVFDSRYSIPSRLMVVDLPLLAVLVRSLLPGLFSVVGFFFALDRFSLVSSYLVISASLVMEVRNAICRPYTTSGYLQWSPQHFVAVSRNSKRRSPWPITMMIPL